MDGKEVIIRTLDVGGDKNIPYLGMEKRIIHFLDSGQSDIVLTEKKCINSIKSID